MTDKIATPASMTLRDWFAGQILNGVLAGPCSRDGASLSEWNDIPAHAYRLADLMLAERAKGQFSATFKDTFGGFLP